MSKFTNKSAVRIERLIAYMKGLMNRENGLELLTKYQIETTIFTPSDIIESFDHLFEEEIDMERLKMASNKLFNILYHTLTEHPSIEAKKGNFIYYLMKNNQGVSQYLTETKAWIKQINKEVKPETLTILSKRFDELQKFTSHYTIKENILFPLIEKKWPHHACLKLMWSFHDSIRQNIKRTLELLETSSFDLIQFNQVCSKVFFNINTIIFREERILFPVMLETLEPEDFKNMLLQSAEIGFQFVNIEAQNSVEKPIRLTDHHIHFKTGTLSLEQAELIFNHLPVDVTFVDEQDRVQFFSNPKHRIFPRSTGIIGRKVQNCHPHESLDVVNKIVLSFKNGEKEVASFWIHMGPKYVLIQYFAVRDANGVYKGVLEVSQDISDIQKITGDKKLLDWEQ